MKTLHDFDAESLRKLNSATQYPSIATYHVLGERGRLTEALNVDFAHVDPDDVEVTEKVDGTNTRLIIPPLGVGNVLVGSRTELLHHDGDVIANAAQDIVGSVRPWLRELREMADASLWLVVFGEVYGGRVTAGSKNYTTNKDSTGFRLFDIGTFTSDVLGWNRERIASWRDAGGQDFFRSDFAPGYADDYGLDWVPTIDFVDPPPASVADTHNWLRNTITKTHAALDNSALARPEGVVVRSADRSQIAKLRFEDYERTAKSAR